MSTTIAPRALLSVYKKDGVVKLATGLIKLGFELVSSGGTATELEKAGINVTEVEEITGFPSMFGGRVKTLHPKIHAAILADQTDPAHMAELDKHGIKPFGLVVVNLYPFESNPSIELIDVGGPTMIRGAAKNYESVGVVTDPDQYDTVLDELQREGTLSLKSRIEMAANAFDLTSGYDAEITMWLQPQIDAL